MKYFWLMHRVDTSPGFFQETRGFSELYPTPSIMEFHFYYLSESVGFKDLPIARLEI